MNLPFYSPSFSLRPKHTQNSKLQKIKISIKSLVAQLAFYGLSNKEIYDSNPFSPNYRIKKKLNIPDN